MPAKEIVKVWEDNSVLDSNIEFLSKPTKEVKFPLDSKSKDVINDLMDSFRKIPCAGIAANQIGYNYRMFIGMKFEPEEKEEGEEESEEDINPMDENNYEIYINPQIDEFSKKSVQEGPEGCLSIPGVNLIIERYDKIMVRYYNQEGKKIRKPLQKFISRLFQHELDHLDGKLMVQRNVIKGYVDDEELGKLYPNLQDKINIL